MVRVLLFLVLWFGTGWQVGLQRAAAGEVVLPAREGKGPGHLSLSSVTRVFPRFGQLLYIPFTYPFKAAGPACCGLEMEGNLEHM